MRALTIADADNLIGAIDRAFADAEKLDTAIAAYNTAAKTVADAHKRGTSRAIIIRLYYPVLQRRYAEVQALVVRSASSEVRMTRSMQAIEYAVFGEVYTYSPDAARRR